MTLPLSPKGHEALIMHKVVVLLASLYPYCEWGKKHEDLTPNQRRSRGLYYTLLTYQEEGEQTWITYE